MEILGIGPLELFFIVLIALIVLGPRDIVKAGRTIGDGLRRLVTSDTWRMVSQTSRRLRHLPDELIREAGLDDEIRKTAAMAKTAIRPEEPSASPTLPPVDQSEQEPPATAPGGGDEEGPPHFE